MNNDKGIQCFFTEYTNSMWMRGKACNHRLFFVSFNFPHIHFNYASFVDGGAYRFAHIGWSVGRYVGQHVDQSVSFNLVEPKYQGSCAQEAFYLVGTCSKIEKVPKGIQSEKSSKGTRKFEKSGLNNWNTSKSQRGGRNQVSKKG